AVSGVAAFAGGNAHDLAIGTDRERPAEIFFPPAEADHLVISGPAGEGVVARVPHIDPAAIAHEGFKVLLHRARPARTAAEVVAGLDDHVVIGELRTPVIPTRRILG